MNIKTAIKKANEECTIFRQGKDWIVSYFLDDKGMWYHCQPVSYFQAMRHKQSIVIYISLFLLGVIQKNDLMYNIIYNREISGNTRQLVKIYLDRLK